MMSMSYTALDSIFERWHSTLERSVSASDALPTCWFARMLFVHAFTAFGTMVLVGSYVHLHLMLLGGRSDSKRLQARKEDSELSSRPRLEVT